MRTIAESIKEALAKKVLSHVDEHNYQIADSIEFLYPGMETDDKLEIVKTVETLLIGKK